VGLELLILIWRELLSKLLQMLSRPLQLNGKVIELMDSVMVALEVILEMEVLSSSQRKLLPKLVH